MIRQHEQREINGTRLPIAVDRGADVWLPFSRKARTSAMVALGFSSMIQCPESGTTPSSTSLAAKRITAAIVVPNDFSPPSARTGTSSLPAATKALLSMASWSKAANCAKPACIAPGGRRASRSAGGPPR